MPNWTHFSTALDSIKQAASYIGIGNTSLEIYFHFSNPRIYIDLICDYKYLRIRLNYRLDDDSSPQEILDLVHKNNQDVHNYLNREAWLC